MTSAKPVGIEVGPYGTRIKWETPDGNIITSSAHHLIPTVEEHSPSGDIHAIGRMLLGENSRVVNETVAFPADNHWGITDFTGLGKTHKAEAHEDAMIAAGYQPDLIPNDWKTSSSFPFSYRWWVPGGPEADWQATVRHHVGLVAIESAGEQS